MNAVSALYESGEGTKRDPVLAYVYYHLAQVLGLDEANANRARLAKLLSPAELTEAKALSAQVKKTRSLPPRCEKEHRQPIRPIAAKHVTLSQRQSQRLPRPSFRV